MIDTSIADSLPEKADSEINDLSSYSDRVRKTQVLRLIEGSGFNNLAGCVMAVIWVGLLWRDLPHVVLGVWLGMMVFLFLCCAVIHHSHLYTVEKAGSSSDVFQRWYLLAVIFIAMGWGITSTLMFPYKEIEQIVLAFILVGVSASGVTYSHVAWVYFTFISFVLAPLMMRFFYMGGEVYYSLSAMTGFFLCVMLMAAYRMNRASSNAQALSYRNEDLIKNITAAHNDLEHLNDELKGEIKHSMIIEGELKQARDKAEQMSRAKGEFLANMSHEIRTPMNGVIGTLQLLEGTKLDKSQSEYVNIAHQSADSLLTILNDILDLSKIEAGKLNLEKIPFNIREVVQNLNSLYSLNAEQTDVVLTIHIDEKVPEFLIGDPTRMRQILGNLISNGLKFTSKGEVSVRVDVHDKNADEVFIKVEVADTGIGIAEEKQQQLFSAFTQADGSTTRKYGGTGLGLAIVRQLVEMMKGELGLESEIGKGARFWFVIPLGISSIKATAKDTEESGEAEALHGRVLLVEDNPVNQMVAKKMLEKIGLDSLMAANGRDALDILEYERVDVVLMDCQMPEMDGFEATRQLREREKSSNTTALPVIAMTANVMEGDRERCLQAGMDDYIGKPVKMNELESVLRRWIKSKA